MMRWFTLLLVAVALFFSGCTHKAGWLYGKWNFDAEYTRQKIEAAPKKELGDAKEGILDALKGLATGLVGPQVAAMLEGSTLRITDKEVIVTTKDGSGKAYAYELVEKPDSDTVTLKLSDGEVNSYHREGDRMWTSSPGTLSMRAYFKRAK